jgi:MFS family permease
MTHAEPISARRFLASFMLLSVISGLAIGMGRIVTTFYVIDLGAGAGEIGIIGAAEALGKMVVTLPAGFLIYRFGARRVYSTATIGSMVMTAVTPFMKIWVGVALMRTLVGFCVPFRVVSMNSAFLRRLREMGASRAGWYRAAQNLGVMLIAPTGVAVLLAATNYVVVYLFVSLCFAFMVVFSRTFLPDDAAEVQADAPTSASRELKELLAYKPVAESCFIEFVSHVVNAVFTTFIIVLAVSELHLSDVQATTLITLQGVTAIAALLSLGPVFRAMQPKYAYTFAIGAGAISLVLLGRSTQFWGLACAAALLSLGSALVHLVNMNQLSQLHLSMSKIAGLYNLSGMLGALVGATAGGLLAEAFGLRNMFVAWIPILTVAVTACVLFQRRRPVRVTSTA